MYQPRSFGKAELVPFEGVVSVRTIRNRVKLGQHLFHAPKLLVFIDAACEFVDRLFDERDFAETHFAGEPLDLGDDLGIGDMEGHSGAPGDPLQNIGCFTSAQVSKNNE